LKTAGFRRGRNPPLAFHKKGGPQGRLLLFHHPPAGRGPEPSWNMVNCLLCSMCY